MMRKKILLCLLLSVVLGGCAAAGVEETPVLPQATATLAAYATRTPAQATPQASLATPTPPPSPTPTPRTHTVAKGEDLGGIAYLYGTTVPALLAANPGVDPYVLSVGMVLIVPGGDEEEVLAANPVATPVPVEVLPPDCWPMQDGGLWCFALVRNPLDSAVESVSVLMRMAASQEETRAWKTAPLLNVIPAGEALPAGVYFSPPVPEVPAVSASLEAALPAADLEARYLPVVLEINSVEISPDGSTATVQGTLALEQEEAVETTVWVALTARNAAGQVVGWRRWERRVSLGGGETAAFTAQVFRVGQTKIASVETLAEARP